MPEEKISKKAAFEDCIEECYLASKLCYEKAAMQNPNHSPNSSDAVDPASGVQLLSEQIEAAKQMLLNQPIQSKEYAAWNDQTRAHLIRVYGERSPNIDTITESVGIAPAWLFMPDDVAERYVTCSLEEKIQRLKGCVVALKRKAQQIA